MSEINPRDFGRLEAEVAALTELVRAQTLAMVSMRTAMDVMNQTLSEARGGWRTLMWLGGAAGSLGGILGWLISHLKIST